MVPGREPVRKRAGDQDTDKGGDIRPEHRIESCRGLALAKLFLKIRRHPCHVAGDHEDQSRETNRQNSGRRCCEHGLETIQDARLAPILLRLLSRGQRLVFQPESHKDTPEYSRHTKNNE